MLFALYKEAKKVKRDDKATSHSNSRADWETEAPRMGAYYSNAYLTIAASSSEDVGQSFLRAKKLITLGDV